jgi:F-type H+-transporting ATPase subunit delta
MSDIETSARPYARAVFELASEESQLQQWQDRLQLAAVIAADSDMLAMFELPSMLTHEQAELFLSVASESAKAEISDDFRNLVALLAENGRLAIFPAIATVFETLKQEAEGRVEVHIRSARELTAEQQENISKSLSKRLGKEVSISTEIDESLIAGAVVTAGDLVIDGSASGRMDKLTTALNK